jgi:polysaccharide export outer membrane protein
LAPTGEYRVSNYDVLDVSVYQVDNLSRTVQVSAVGTITLPLIGDVPAAGRTTREIETTVRDKLGEKYLQNPLVSVTIKTASAQSVTVDGAVQKPGVFPLTGTVTLAQSVALAGGLNDVGNRSAVTLTRTAEGRRTVTTYDVAKIQKGEATDPVLLAGDIVTVPESGGRAFMRDSSRTLAPLMSGVGAIRPW